MSFKHFLFNLGFAAAWFLLMPVFMLGVGVALFSYAIATEVGE